MITGKALETKILDIHSKPFEKLLADMDMALGVAMRQILDKGTTTGNVTAKIAIELQKGTDTMGRKIIEPKFKFTTTVNIPLKAKLESQAAPGIFLEDIGGEYVIIGQQVTMDDAIRNAG